MMRVIHRSGWVLLLATVALTGCANNKEKQRMSMFEATNRDLTGRLNRASTDLEQAMQERDQLYDQLLAARGQSDDLRAQLANMPEPEPAAAGWTTVPGGAMIAIDDRVLFQPGKITLRPEAKRVLDGLVSTLQGEYGDRDVIVFGHTDDQPIKKSGWMDNWQLSTERSLAVVRYLQEHGVATTRLVAAGCGEFRPRSANASEESRAQNRRVSIFAADPTLQLGRPQS